MLACDMALYDKQDGWLIYSKQNRVFPAHDVASQKTKKKLMQIHLEFHEACACLNNPCGLTFALDSTLPLSPTKGKKVDCQS